MLVQYEIIVHGIRHLVLMQNLWDTDGVKVYGIFKYRNATVLRVVG